MRPVLADLGRGRIYALALLGAVKALGLVLMADAVASGLVSLAAHSDAWRTALLGGVLGALLRAAASWGLQVASARTAAGVKESLRARLLRRLVLGSRPARDADRDAEHARAETGLGAETALATTALDELDQYYTVFLPTLISAATVPLLVGVRILFADWVSALIIVLTVPLIPVFMVLIGMRTRDDVAAATTALTRLSDHLVELARGLPVLVGLGRVLEQTQALREISDEHRRRSMTTLRTAFMSSLALELISTISVALVAVFVGVRLVAGDMPLEAGLVALLLAPECYAPFRDIGAAFHSSRSGIEARERVRTALEEAPDDDALVRTVSDGRLSVAGLSVRHPDRSVDAVAAVTFTARPGQLVSVDGPSGAGKTTLLEVLVGRGATRVAGAVLGGAIAAPRELAWLPQHPHVSARRVRDELADYGATDASIPSILDRLGLSALVEADPATLSPGELRRLAFGRVLARVDAGARLVVLDEPTAHLDAESAERVRRAIRGLRGRATVVLASHDAKLRELAEVHVALGGGAPAIGSSTAEQESGASDSAGRDSLAARAEELESFTAAASAARPRRRQERARSIHELLAFLRPVRGRVLAAAGVGSAASLFAAALTALSGWLIVRAAEHPHILYLMVAMVGVRFFGIGRAALRYSERLLTHGAVFTAVTELRVRLWKGLAAQGPAGRTALTPANTLDRLIGDADSVRDLVPRVVIPPISAVVTVAAAVVTLWVFWRPAGLLAAGLALVGVVAAPLVALAADAHASRSRDLARSKTVRGAASLLGSADELAANGVAESALARLRSLDGDAARAARRAAWAGGAGQAVVVAACALASLAMIALSAPQTVHGPLPVPLAAVFVFAPLTLIDPLIELVGAVQKWPALRAVLARVGAVTEGAEHEERGGQAVVAPVSRLGLAGVSYRYPDAAHDALHAVDADAQAGEWLVVTGPSGSGKSTMLGVLLRYLRPTGGRYEVDDAGGGHDAAMLDAESLRRRVAWAPQEGHLFNSTMRGNLLLARSRDDAPSDAELVDVLGRVGLASLMASLPLGLDTPIGAEGSFLSGGQRQRVAVARTLLARFDAVLLDEPTAHLDEASARSLMRDLRTALADKTAVLVTHHAVGVRPGDRHLRLLPGGAATPGSEREDDLEQVPVGASVGGRG